MGRISPLRDKSPRTNEKMSAAMGYSPSARGSNSIKNSQR